MKFDRSNKFDFATAKIECSFETPGKVNILYFGGGGGGNMYFAGDGTWM